MDETPPPFPQTTPLPGFKDWRAGLMVFGILEMLAGAVCVLFVPLMIFGQAVSAKATHSETSLRLVLPAIFVYAILAVIFVWLGIGSVLARRWARALSLIFAWTWLVMGVVVIVFYAVALPKIFTAAGPGGQTLPAAARGVAMVAALIILGFLFVLVPGAMVLFYGSKHAKATCEVRDPIVRWTDNCPLPLLGICLWLWLGAAMILLMPVYNGVIAFFGTFLSGWLGMIMYVLLAAIWVYAARDLYQRKSVGWWLVTVTMLVFMVSNVITFARADMTEMYRAMGYPEAQITRIEQYSLLKGSGMMWWSVAWVVPLFGYLIYVRRFLAKPGAEQGGP